MEIKNSVESEERLFAAGDAVEFDLNIKERVNISPGDSLGVDDLIGKYGQGPFKVKSVRESPVGQMLMIELEDGRVMPMSSQWMKKATS